MLAFGASRQRRYVGRGGRGVGTLGEGMGNAVRSIAAPGFGSRGDVPHVGTASVVCSKELGQQDSMDVAVLPEIVTLACPPATTVLEFATGASNIGPAVFVSERCTEDGAERVACWARQSVSVDVPLIRWGVACISFS